MLLYCYFWACTLLFVGVGGPNFCGCSRILAEAEVLELYTRLGFHLIPSTNNLVETIGRSVEIKDCYLNVWFGLIEVYNIKVINYVRSRAEVFKSSASVSNHAHFLFEMSTQKTLPILQSSILNWQILKLINNQIIVDLNNNWSRYQFVQSLGSMRFHNPYKRDKVSNKIKIIYSVLITSSWLVNQVKWLRSILYTVFVKY